MALVLTTDQSAVITALDAPMDTAFASGVTLPGGVPPTIDPLKGYADLKTNDPVFGDQKAAVKNIFKQVFAAWLNVSLAAPTYNQITDYGSGWGLWGDGNYSNGQFRYYKDSLGYVIVEGLVRTPLSPAAYTIIATLPVGFRPAPGDAKIFACVSNEAFASIQVGYDGTIVYRGTPAANTWVSIALRFRQGG